MTSITLLAFMNLAIALILAGGSIPLILRKVPMNDSYGVRFPQAFKSQEAWYEINAYGGKMLLLSSLPVLVLGLCGFFWQPESYATLTAVVLMASTLLAGLMSYLKARRVDAKGG
ncbi:MAG TPA: SdpI family protein [Chthoniobacteraceae bacterium]|nr:SdpI family protein [Chthoniobacteraceae bacterium]